MASAYVACIRNAQSVDYNLQCIVAKRNGINVPKFEFISDPKPDIITHEVVKQLEKLYDTVTHRAGMRGREICEYLAGRKSN